MLKGMYRSNYARLCSWNFFATDTTAFTLGSILTDLEGSNEGKECIAPMMLYGLFFFFGTVATDTTTFALG